MNINNAIREHLLAFLNKALDQSYTRNEWENFAISIYQNDELDNIRKTIVEIIGNGTGADDFKNKTISKDTRNSIQELIKELDRINIQ